MAATIGVLALQGAFIEHCRMLERLGVKPVQVRLPQHLQGLKGLILPGGESTTMGKLMLAYNLLEPLRAFGRDYAMWGTCAGAILLARDAHRDQPLLKLMDIAIERNAFGRQIDSFSAPLDMPCLDHLTTRERIPFEAVFIRAPVIEEPVHPVDVLARLADGKVVAAQQGKLLATSFHPELTGDTRLHRYFLEMV